MFLELEGISTPKLHFNFALINIILPVLLSILCLV